MADWFVLLNQTVLTLDGVKYTVTLSSVHIPVTSLIVPSTH